MRRLVWAFAGDTKHIVGNLMSRLKYNSLTFKTFNLYTLPVNRLHLGFVWWYIVSFLYKFSNMDTITKPSFLLELSKQSN